MWDKDRFLSEYVYSGNENKRVLQRPCVCKSKSMNTKLHGASLTKFVHTSFLPSNITWKFQTELWVDFKKFITQTNQVSYNIRLNLDKINLVEETPNISKVQSPNIPYELSLIEPSEYETKS